jgi:flagellin-like protein
MESGEIGWRIRYRIRTPYIRTTPKSNLINDFTQLLNEMRRHKSRSAGLSPLVAVILLIAITVAAAVVVSGVFFNLAGIAGRRPTAAIDQVRLIASPSPSATYAATFAIVLKNTGDVPISGNPTVSFSYPVTGCSPSSTTPTWGGSRDPGGTYSATVTITGATCTLLGRTVTVTVTVNFADGSQQILTTGVTGALA